jgi:hypothetical protein
VRCHYTEVDLLRRPPPRLAAQEERDPAESLAIIERARQSRDPRELSVVGSPVRQGNPELLNAQWRLGVLQRAERVRGANEPMGAG